MKVSTNKVVQKLQMTSSGFTLIELMVTIAVLAIIVSIAAPNISNQLADQRVKSTTATLTNALKEAKTESIVRRQPLILNFDDNSKLIKIQHVVDGQIKSTIASYKYDNKSIIKPSNGSTQFKPNKIATATVYTICDSNTSVRPQQVEINKISNITTKLGGTC